MDPWRSLQTLEGLSALVSKSLVVARTEVVDPTEPQYELLETIRDRQIPAELFISSGTASRHVANILHKLDIRSRSAAAAWAIRHDVT